MSIDRMNPGKPVVVNLTDSGQSLAALSSDLPQSMGGVIIAVPDANHDEGENTGTVYVGNEDAQHLAIPLTRTVGVLYPFTDPAQVYLKSSASSGDHAIVVPLI